MARKKKKTILAPLQLVKYAAEGKSIAQLEDGKTLFVTGGVVGDEVEVLVLKNKKSYAEGKVLRILKPAANRQEPFCAHFGICGGCKWQMLPYEAQLEYKTQQVQDQLQRIGQVGLPDLRPILGSERQQAYRNKLEFTFCNRPYLSDADMQALPEGTFPELRPVLGFHAPGRYDKVVDIQTCYLQAEPTNQIKNFLRSYTQEKGYTYYDPKTQEGWLRNVIIRVATTGDVMVNLIVKDWKDELAVLLDDLLQAVPEITSLHYTLNPKVNDAIYDLEVVTWKGPGFIEEKLEDFRFKISPKSFFQTNTRQAETLYRIVRDFAGLSGEEVLYDLYCGTGSIGIFLSKGAKKIIGIETVEDAVRDARENAAWNQLDNCLFFSGDVSKIATEAFFETHGRPDVIVTDPPRAGMHEQLIRQLLQLRAPRLIYVSCNPATQARDLQLLDEAYKVVRLQPVDMFPHTHHIENVALLELKTPLPASRIS